uniref:Uncharacterized protein n=1 Tax=Rhizophora mucronata TaxID=61149 RepID=A0A2P2M5E0_RHIMU
MWILFCHSVLLKMEFGVRCNCSKFFLIKDFLFNLGCPLPIF